MSRKFYAILFLWLVAGAAAGAYLYFAEPSGPLKWLLWALAGPVAYVTISGTGELLVAGYFRLPGIRQVTAFVERRSRAKQVSLSRLLWYLFNVLLVLGLGLAIIVAVRLAG